MFVNEYSMEGGTSIKDSLQELFLTARRNHILDAATKVFAEKGFHATTIKDIAKGAGVADGTIYNYFENKTALLLGLLDRMNETDQREQDFSTFTKGDFRGFMRAYLRHRLMVLKADNFETFRVVISEILINKELRELHYQKVLEPTMRLAEIYFQQWADQHVIKPVNVPLTMRAISGMVLGIILQHIMGDKLEEAQWNELPDVLTDLILSGLRSDESL